MPTNQAPEPKQIEQWLTDLDDPALRTSEAASRGLAAIKDKSTLIELSTKITDKLSDNSWHVIKAALGVVAKGLMATKDPTTKTDIRQAMEQKIATVSPNESIVWLHSFADFANSYETTNEMLFALNSPTIVVQGAPDPHPITDKTLVVIGKKISSFIKRPMMFKDNADSIMVSTNWGIYKLEGDKNMQDSVRADDFSFAGQSLESYSAHLQFYVEFLKNAELMNPELKGKILSEYKIA